MKVSDCSIIGRQKYNLPAATIYIITVTDVGTSFFEVVSFNTVAGTVNDQVICCQTPLFDGTIEVEKLLFAPDGLTRNSILAPCVNVVISGDFTSTENI